MPQTRIAFRELLRSAVVTLLNDYASDQEVKLTVYRARPKSIAPPHAFIDRITERVDYIGPVQMRRVPIVEVVIIHRLFDGGDAADQADRFVDGFLDWIADRPHSADPNTVLGVTSVEDDPTYSADWIAKDYSRGGVQLVESYYATRISLEGLALD
jgi:hypothetical protein